MPRRMPFARLIVALFFVSGCVSAAPAPEVLLWAAGPLSFELASPHPPVLDRARTIFGPWLNGASGSRTQRVRFLVEAEGGSLDGRWRVVLGLKPSASE